MAIDTCRGWMVPREERRQALGRGLWLLSSEPVVRAPTCLQTFFFFSPSDFKIKIKNFKKEFKEKKKKKKTSVVKKPIFRTQIRYFRALGLNSVVFPSGHRRGLLSTVPFVEVTSCGHCLAHADALSGKPGFPRDSSTPFHVFCHPTPSTEDVIKKNNNKK